MNWKLVLFNLKLHEEEDENKKPDVSLTDTTHMRLCSRPRILSSRLRKGENYGKVTTKNCQGYLDNTAIL